MSIEARINISATFADEEIAKKSTAELKRELKKNNFELASALDTLNTIENQSYYKDQAINVEEITRKKNVVSVSSYTYTSESPVWFTKSLAQLGANKIFIRGQWDDVGRSFYFLKGEKVTKTIFDGDKPKKELSAKDIEINSKLFLPEKRVIVKVKLVSAWSVGDIYESTGMEFKSVCGNVFYYKGAGQLVDMFWNSDLEEFDTSITVEFGAAFERGKVADEFVSFVKRPTKITLYE